MPRRKRRFSLKDRKSGSSFWIRPNPFDITQQLTNPGIFSDVVLAEADFKDPNIALNDTKRGAPILERIICDLRFALTVDNNYFDPAGFAQVTMLVEAMLFTQTDQFGTIVASDASYNQSKENQRILGYALMDWDVTLIDETSTANRWEIRCQKMFEPRTKVNLREKAVAVALRTNMDLANAAITATFASVQTTMLVRVP